MLASTSCRKWFQLRRVLAFCLFESKISGRYYRSEKVPLIWFKKFCLFLMYQCSPLHRSLLFSFLEKTTILQSCIGTPPNGKNWFTQSEMFAWLYYALCMNDCVMLCVWVIVSCFVYESLCHALCMSNCVMLCVWVIASCNCVWVIVSCFVYEWLCHALCMSDCVMLCVWVIVLCFVYE